MSNEKKNPAVGGGGAGRDAPGLGAGCDFIILHSRRPVKSPLALLALQAATRAARDLAAAEQAKASGDRSTYERLRRRGLRHQAIWCFITAKGGVE